MARQDTSLFDAPGFGFDNGTLIVRHGGEVTINKATDGSWFYSQGNQVYTLDAQDVRQITGIEAFSKGVHLSLRAEAVNAASFSLTGAGPINISGVTFTEAGPAGAFYSNADLRAANFDLNNLSVNGGRGADYFATIWASLDGLVGLMQTMPAAGGSAWDVASGGGWMGYNDETAVPFPILGQTIVGDAAAALNTAFLNLGVQYINYLEAGGPALTDITAKYAADGTDAGSSPDRYQSLHDNILGNLNLDQILARNLPDPSGDGSAWTAAEISAYIPGSWESRPYYSGSETAGVDMSAAHNFDLAHNVAMSTTWQADYLYPFA